MSDLPQEQGTGGYRVGYGKPPREHRFVEGKSGNPGGRPRGASILAPLLRILAAEPNAAGEGKEAVALAEQAVKYARAGIDIGPILKLIERTDGAVTQKVEQSGVLTQIISKRVPSQPAAGTNGHG